MIEWFYISSTRYKIYIPYIPYIPFYFELDTRVTLNSLFDDDFDFDDFDFDDFDLELFRLDDSSSSESSSDESESSDEDEESSESDSQIEEKKEDEEDDPEDDLEEDPEDEDVFEALAEEREIDNLPSFISCVKRERIRSVTFLISVGVNDLTSVKTATMVPMR